jgi:hypothetical protein
VREQFGDGELRIRFEATGLETLRFAVRQGGDGAVSAYIESSAYDGKPHDLVFVCSGETVQATLDGRPLDLERVGRPLRGHLQFNYTGKSLRVLSIETRPLP